MEYGHCVPIWKKYGNMDQDHPCPYPTLWLAGDPPSSPVPSLLGGGTGELWGGRSELGGARAQLGGATDELWGF